MKDALVRFYSIFGLTLFFAISPANSLSGDENPTEAMDSPIAEKPFTVEVQKEVTYGDGQDRSDRCDIYLPRRDGDNGKTPVVLAVHGGAWMSGDKWTMRNHAFRLAAKGIAVVSINYRLAPKHKFPRQVDDVRDALIWIAEHAEEYRFDTKRLGLYGYSAGGHLVSLVATVADEPWESLRVTSEWERDDPRWSKLPNIVAVLAGAPPTDFEGYPPMNTAMVYFLGGTRKQKPEVYRAASPLAQLSKDDPPIHIVHGDADLLVSINSSRLFLERSAQEESEVALTVVPRQGHLFTFISPKMAETLVAFFDEQLLQTD
ncbi:MAG: alpha/beta hydrolase [Planctomycetota bacterium]